MRGGGLRNADNHTEDKKTTNKWEAIDHVRGKLNKVQTGGGRQPKSTFGFVS